MLSDDRLMGIAKKFNVNADQPRKAIVKEILRMIDMLEVPGKSLNGMGVMLKMMLESEPELKSDFMRELGEI